MANEGKYDLMHGFLIKNKIIIIFIAGFLIFYAAFILFMRTPWYTAMQLKFAYKNNNVAMLVQDINMASVVYAGYDDVTGDLFTYNTSMQPKAKQIFDQFYKLIKEDICNGTLQMINSYLKNDTWADPSKTSVLKGRDLGIDYDELLDRSMLRNTAVRKIGTLLKDDNNNYILPVTVADRYTNTDYVLQLQLERNAVGMWQVTKILNYHDYLIHVRELCDVDINSYIKDTRDRNAQDNKQFQALQIKFQALTKPLTGNDSQAKRTQVQNFITQQIIPAYASHENYLQNVNVPSGALHLHMLRLQSTSKTIEAWKYYADGIGKNSKADLAKAEYNHQITLTLEQKVSDIINKMPALFVPEIP